MQQFRSFWRCENGATAIEYAIIAGSIALVIVAAVGAIGTPLSNTFMAVSGGFK